MSIDLFWLHAVVLGAVLVIVYFMHMKTVRLRARFQMYRVRDNLVLLVANGTLKEDGRIFPMFYKRVNSCLVDDHPMGMDDLVDVILRSHNGDTREELITEARRRLKEIQGDREAQNPEVRAVISGYYSALFSLLMAHSNVVRLLYKISHIAFLSALDELLVKSVPKRVRNEMATVDFVVSEAHAFAPH